jgi:hypothetical protein
MAAINIANGANRDAVVGATSLRSKVKISYLDASGFDVKSICVLKGALGFRWDDLIRLHGGDLEAATKALIDQDPDVDFERFGRIVGLGETSQIYVNDQNEYVSHLSFTEVVYNPDGSERERRPMKVVEQNTVAETPLRWTGRLIAKDEAIRKFVFSRSLQLVHSNGLTYDFLYGMAKELHDANALKLLGSGPRSNGRLVFQRGGRSYFGFLEGRVDDQKYALVLHLSELEMKTTNAGEAT